MSKTAAYPTVQLEEAVDVLDHLRIPVNGTERLGRAGTVPYYGANGHQGWIDRPLFNEPLILLAEDGGNFEDFATRPIAYRIEGPAWVNNHAHIIRAKAGVCQNFIFWSLVNKDIRRFIAGGTRTKLTQGELRHIEISLPEIQDQKKTAQILDTLDIAIRNTEAIIDKLNAVKQGLLHDLLTCGIDANGNLRPPQSEAPDLYKTSPLGWIPKDWDCRSVGTLLTTIEAGKSPSCPDMPAPSGRWGVLKVSAVHPDGFRPDQNKIIENIHFVNPEYEVRSGDLLITRANTPELVGMVCLVSSPQPKLMLCDKTLRMQVNSEIASKQYLFLCLQQPHVRTQIQSSATGTSMSMKNISQKAIRNLLVSTPPLREQISICARTEALASKLLFEIATCEKLRQKKSGLMNDLLTGHVRVTPLLEEAAP